jgi:glycosyltransferase involved in cell wall biosynthesis
MKEYSPLVSVIINCFNGEAFLKEAIESVIKQSYKNYEIIFFNNQSTDSSLKIAKSFNNKKIRIFNARKHTNLGKARNQAISFARGDLFAFLDCDDAWLEDKLFYQVNEFRDADVGLVISNCIYKEQFLEKLAFRNKFQKGYLFKDLFLNYFVMLPTLIIRKEAFFDLGDGFNNNFYFCEDPDLVMRLASKWKLACVNKPLAIYRMHDNNLTSKNPELLLQESYETYTNLLKYLKKNNSPLLEWAILNKDYFSVITSSYWGLFYSHWKNNNSIKALKTFKSIKGNLLRKIIMAFLVFFPYSFFLAIKRKI